MTTATTTKTITLTDLAGAVNRLIETQPNARNPEGDETGSCLYFQPETEMRCLIGQALYDLTGKNVPSIFEEIGIESLLQNIDFLGHFNLEVEENFGLENAIVDAQGVADGHARWGVIDKINVGAVGSPCCSSGRR